MKRPVIVATPEGVSALGARLGRDCDLVAATSPEEALEHLERLANEDAPVLLVELDPTDGAASDAVARASSLAPGAVFALSRPLPSGDGSRETIVLAPGSEGLATLAAILLSRSRLERRTAERERQLDLVTSAGVAMASSFDIRAILERTRDAAREVLDGANVHVYYRGCAAINARPRWYPQGAREDVDAEARARIEALVSREIPWVPREEPGALPIAHRGTCLGALVLFDDALPLTEDRRKLLQVLALQAATALGNIHTAQERIQFERLSTIGRMIGSIVHDLRSPLTALRGYAGMLHTLELQERERHEFTAALLDECDRLDHMVDDLLQFSRGRSLELDRRPTHIGRYLERLAGRARRHYGDAVRVELDAPGDEEVLIDRKRFERALWNAVTNACQAMAASGGRLGLSARREGERVEIAIRDEGEGIPEEIRHRIFEPFFSHGKSEGIGLGMATAKRIVEEHGGEIEVESRRGEGTRIRVLLPLAPVEDAEELAAQAARR